MSDRAEAIHRQEALTALMECEGYQMLIGVLQGELLKADTEYHSVKASDSVRVAELQSRHHTLTEVLDLPGVLLAQAIDDAENA